MSVRQRPARRSHASREHRGVRPAGPRGAAGGTRPPGRTGGGCRAGQGSAERCPGPAGFPLAPSALRTAAGLPDGSRRGDRAGPAGSRPARPAGRATPRTPAAPGRLTRSRRPAGARGPAGPPGPPAAAPLSLQVTPAPYQLPSGLAREVVLPHGPDLLIAGGLTRPGHLHRRRAPSQPLDRQHHPGGPPRGPHARRGRSHDRRPDLRVRRRGAGQRGHGAGDHGAQAIRGRRSRPAAGHGPGHRHGRRAAAPPPLRPGRGDPGRHHIPAGRVRRDRVRRDGPGHHGRPPVHRRGAAGGPGPLPGGRRAGRPDLGLRRPDQPRHHERHPADQPSRCGPRGRRSDR